MKSYLWVEQLAEQEIDADMTGIVHLPNEDDQLRLLDGSSIELMEMLRNEFEVAVSFFNEHMGKNFPQKQIKTFKIANTVNDFMLFRQSIKLVVSRKAVDLISVSLIKNAGDNKDFYVELVARFGAFQEINWWYQDQKIQLSPVVQFLVTKFIKESHS
jgi:hypothetical protein